MIPPDTIITKYKGKSTGNRAIADRWLNDPIKKHYVYEQEKKNRWIVPDNPSDNYMFAHFFNEADNYERRL